MLFHVRKMHVCYDSFDVTLLIVKKNLLYIVKSQYCLFCQYYNFNESLLCAKVLV